LTRNRLYGLLATISAAGYGWIYYNLKSAVESDMHACLFKKVAGIPCPSCGSTRSVISLMQGDIVQAVLWNPMGLVLLISMALIPLWIAYDLFNKKRTLFVAYRKAELFFSRKRFAIPALVLLLANWMWNIYKGL
jgi:Protein of unknown function (DUF2752)